MIQHIDYRVAIRRLFIIKLFKYVLNEDPGSSDNDILLSAYLKKKKNYDFCNELEIKLVFTLKCVLNLVIKKKKKKNGLTITAPGYCSLSTFF